VILIIDVGIFFLLKKGKVTIKIFRFTDGIFRRYLHYHSVGKKITDGMSPSVIFFPSVCPLVIKKY
jgi:hypothetical protein